MTSGLISIIIPVYNKISYLEETLSSVCNQSYPNLEILLIDDASTDGSLELLKKWSLKDPRIKLFPHAKNQGGNKCRNIGIEKASGEFTLIFDADDLLKVNCLENRLALFEEDTDGVLCSMGVFKEVIGDMGEKLNWNPHIEGALERFFKHDLPWTIMQPLWKTQKLKDVRGFDENFQRLQDVELHTRLLTKNLSIKVNPSKEPDCFYRVIEGRHSMDRTEFYSRWVSSAHLYFQKHKSLNKTSEKYLSGTIIETTSQLLNASKTNEITKKTARNLFYTLLDNTLKGKNRLLILLYFNIQNSSPIRVKGFKKLVHILSHGV